MNNLFNKIFYKNIYNHYIIIISLCNLINCDEFIVNPNIPQNGLVAFYPFNGNAKDNSINKNDGIIYNEIMVKDRFDQESSAYNFNGINTYIIVNNNYFISLKDSLTISAWINIPEIPNTCSHILNKSQTYGIFEYGFNLWNIGGCVVSAIAGGSIYKEIYTDPIHINRWYHIVATWKFPGYFSIYLNGKKQESIKTWRSIDNLDGSLVIGRLRSDFNNECFVGIIDDIRIYNIVLTDVQINNLYHEGGWQE